MDAAGDATVSSYRERITAVDGEILDAVNRRIALVAELHAHKRAQGYPMRDPAREQALIDIAQRPPTLGRSPSSDWPSSTGCWSRSVPARPRASPASPAEVRIPVPQHTGYPRRITAPQPPSMRTMSISGGGSVSTLTEHLPLPMSSLPQTTITRRYGEGDAAVDALRGVDRRDPARPVHGRDGPVRLRQVDADAHPGRPRPADRGPASRSTASDITEMGDQELTLLRRDHIGFIFQFFNLLPMLTAEENIVLPLRIAGRTPERGWVDEIIGQGRPGRPPPPPPGPALRRPAAARRDRPRPVTRPTVMFADEPTGNLDSTTSEEILRCCARRSRATARPRVMVTHDAARGRHGRPDPVPGRRPDRARPGPFQRRRTCSTAMKEVSASDHASHCAACGAERLRTVLTAISIVLGTAMITGTFVVRDQITGAFTDIFETGLEKTDVVPRRRPPSRRATAPGRPAAGRR